MSREVNQNKTNLFLLIKKTKRSILVSITISVLLVGGSLLLMQLKWLPKTVGGILLFTVLFFFVRSVWLDYLYLRRLILIGYV
ncbi:hypothetical protein NEF87_000151 [Candidatus Lokiarchaeum ossiferum]|uniref:Uncharacterized protein n=1 Tax=Candidatus Lokiarchaeum ossiferum TaxID=2951803 RepID=A0ABY6HKB9_9ARCH|nr:hypothetical protein NEF87_000151 [Candidatus Lokiarchaeum sp. B-35]